MSKRPGRLGNPDLTFAEDPRADRRIAEVLALMGMVGGDLQQPDEPASQADVVSYCDQVEAAQDAANAVLAEALPSWPDIATSTQTITGNDGNAITLHISRPKDATGDLPGIYHIHGGGMTIMTATDPGFIRFRNDLARRGAVVVGVEFRNAAGKLGAHPFPAGLNDCADGLRWAYAQRAELGVSHFVVAGESGGGNLSLATALKAKQEGWLFELSGVYAMCPYISGAYDGAPDTLPSLVENDGYLLDCATMRFMARAYDPDRTERNNPLAWPLQASNEQLQGLPPHVISVNELDPLRDEGLAFYRKLLNAGVPTLGRTVNGTPHAGDQIFGEVAPEIYAELIDSIVGFAERLPA